MIIWLELDARRFPLWPFPLSSPVASSIFSSFPASFFLIASSIATFAASFPFACFAVPPSFFCPASFASKHWGIEPIPRNSQRCSTAILLANSIIQRTKHPPSSLSETASFGPQSPCSHKAFTTPKLAFGEFAFWGGGGMPFGVAGIASVAGRAEVVS